MVTWKEGQSFGAFTEGFSALGFGQVVTGKVGPGFRVSSLIQRIRGR